MTERICSCGKPLRNNATICEDCADQVAEALTSVGALVDDLNVTLTRQDRIGGGGGGTNERPLPFNVAASTQLGSLTKCLTRWASVIREGRDMSVDCGRHPAALAGWILPSVVWMQTHPEAPAFVDEITREVHRARHVIDRPAEKWYAGPCSDPVEVDGETIECDIHLYARPGSMTVACPRPTRTGAPHARHDVSERRAWMLKAAEDYLETASTIARALSSMGQDVTKAKIAGYKARGKIAPHGTDADGHDLFRIGDVIDAVNDAAAKRTKPA